MMKKKITLTMAGLALGSLALAACGNVSNEGGGAAEPEESAGGESPWAQCDMTEGLEDTTSMEADSNKEIKLGAFNGWDESFATTHLLKHVLEEDGYTVTIDAYEAAPAFTAVAGGDIDALTDAWLPLTHADYIDEYGDDLESLGCWYDNAKLTIAVNEDSPAQSIGDLAEMGDEYDNKLFGIEAGAGLTKQTQDSAIPTYGLDNLDFVVSSTPAMLTELKSRTEAGENIAVTLWRPHWAYDAFPVRDLEDPEEAMGGAELVYNFSRTGFAEDNPKAAQLIKNMVIDDEHLASLENIMFSEEHYNGEDNDAAVAEWLKESENQQWLEQWQKGELGG